MATTTVSSQLGGKNAAKGKNYFKMREKHSRVNEETREATHSNEEIDKSISSENMLLNVFENPDNVLEAYMAELSKTHLGEHEQEASVRFATEMLLIDHFNDYVEERNAKNDKKHHDRVTTVKAFVDDQIDNKEAIQGTMFTIGSKLSAEENELLDTPEQRALFNEAAQKFITWHNDRFKTMTIVDAFTHVDEKFPHIHGAVVPHGHTLGGKPSTSLNAALAEEYGYYDPNDPEPDLKKRRRLPSTKTFEMYRDETDKMFLQFVNEAYGKNMQMVRTGSADGLDAAQHKQKAIEAANAKASKQIKEKIDQADEYFKKTVKHGQHNVAKVEKAEQAEMINKENNEIFIDHMYQQLAAAEAKREANEEKLKEKEAELAEREAKAAADKAAAEAALNDNREMLSGVFNALETVNTSVVDGMMSVPDNPDGDVWNRPESRFMDYGEAISMRLRAQIGAGYTREQAVPAVQQVKTLKTAPVASQSVPKAPKKNQQKEDDGPEI